jgi:hypothetical protein
MKCVYARHSSENKQESILTERPLDTPSNLPTYIYFLWNVQHLPNILGVLTLTEVSER